MQKSEIKVGEEYALRELREPDAPLQRVRILQHVRGKKWKAEWIEPNPGFVEYVESQNLLVRWKRAAFERTKGSPLTYVDRHGTIHVPFVEALELAKAFCAAEPSTVLVGIEATERKWNQEASQPGGDYLVGLLNEYRTARAIIRQWAGYDAAIAQREAQIQWLERLVWDPIYALQKAGLDDEAHRLRRALGRS